MKKDIVNIRYGREDKIDFDYLGICVSIREPKDVILVGSEVELAQQWIWNNYRLMLDGLSTKRDEL